MRTRWQRSLLAVLDQVSVILFMVVLVVFGLLSPEFLTAKNLSNIVVQAASTGIVATGMTFVLLTAGVDLSVGAIMFVGAAVAGKCVLAGMPVPAAVIVMILVGCLCGGVNALLVTKLRILAFVATLGTYYCGRGFSIYLTETRALRLPDAFLDIGTSRLLGLPVPIWVFGVVAVTAHLALTRTPYGRQVYAVGQDLEGAKQSGVNTRWVLASVYLVSGFCAGVGGVLALAQLGTVSQTFGTNKEFMAIAAAVLGGTSLFGGRGWVLPGTVLGALLMQSVENGLVLVGANEYVFRLMLSAIIFLAVGVDSGRSVLLQRLTRRPIRVERTDR